MQWNGYRERMKRAQTTQSKNKNMYEPGHQGRDRIAMKERERKKEAQSERSNNTIANSATAHTFDTLV